MLLDKHTIVEQLTPLYGEREAGLIVHNLYLDLFNGRQQLAAEDIRILESSVKRLLQYEPLQYVTGKAFFRDFVLSVAPGVLIPRPETEELVDIAIRVAKNKKCHHVLDIGTGSGCIALALKKAIPHLKVTAIDKSAEALTIAKENAQKLGLDIEWLACDFLDEKSRSALTPSDLIVSNPPYIGREESHTLAPNVLRYEPELALFAEGDPLVFYKAIARFGFSAQIPVVCEINEKWGSETRTCFLDAGYSNVLIHQDLQGKDRFVIADIQLPITSGS